MRAARKSGAAALEEARERLEDGLAAPLGASRGAANEGLWSTTKELEDERSLIEDTVYLGSTDIFFIKFLIHLSLLHKLEDMHEK